MLGACAALLARGGFLTVATPLLLVGSVFHEVAVRLQVQSSNSFRYALMEFGAATEAQIMADRSLQKAVADQTLVDELVADSSRQEGVAAEDEATAGANGEESATANEAAMEGASEGDALAVAKAAGNGNLEAGLAEAVKESAAKTAAKVAAAAAAKEAAAAAAKAAMEEVGSAAAAEEAAGAAAEGAVGTDLAADVAVVDEAAEAAALETGGLAAPVAGVVIAGSAAVAEAPGAIGAIKGEWGAATAEIQAARDEVVATEKQVEAEALEAGSAVYEEGSLAAGRAAAASAAAGVASLAASQGFQLLALALQAPVALIVLHQKCGSAALALCSVGSGLPGTGHATAIGAAANVLLAASLGLVLGGPWARTVTAAAFWEADYFDFSSLSESLQKVMPHLEEHKRQKEQSQHRGNKTHVQEHSATRQGMTTSRQPHTSSSDTLDRSATIQPMTSSHQQQTSHSDAGVEGSSSRQPVEASRQHAARHRADTTSQPALADEERSATTQSMTTSRQPPTSRSEVLERSATTQSLTTSRQPPTSRSDVLERSATTQSLTTSRQPPTSRSDVLVRSATTPSLTTSRQPPTSRSDVLERSATTQSMATSRQPPTSRSDLLGGSRSGFPWPTAQPAAEAAPPAGWLAEDSAPASVQPPPLLPRDAAPPGWESPAESPPAPLTPTGWSAPAAADSAEPAPEGWAKRRLWGLADFAHDVVSSGRDGFQAVAGGAEKTREAVQGSVGKLQNNSAVQQLEHSVRDAEQGVEHAAEGARPVAEGAERVAGIVGHGAEGALRKAEHVVEPGVQQALRNGSERLKSANQKVQGVLATGSAVAESAEHEIQDAVNKSPAAPVVREVKKLADNASRHVAGAVKTAGVAARNATVEVAKEVLVPPANTATTSVAPLTTAPPPEMQSSWNLFKPALSRVGESILHWVGPLLADLALVSLAFVACELAVSSGRHYRSSHGGHISVIGHLLHDVSTKWMQGAGLLVAVWLLSIILASKLRPVAEVVAEYTDGSLGAARFLLGGACCALCAYQAHLLSRLECECKAKSSDGEEATYSKLLTDEEQPQESQEQSEEQSQAFSQAAEQPLLEQARREERQQEEVELTPRGSPATRQQDPEHGQPPPEPTEERSPPTMPRLQEVELPPWRAEEPQPLQEAPSAGRLCVEVSCLGAAVASAASGLLAMAEAPMTSWAMASAVKSTLSSKWLMSILPWSLVVEDVLAGWPPCLVSSPWPLLAAALLLSGCLGFLLALARHGDR